MMFVGGMWKTLELWTYKMVGGFKWGLMGHPNRSMEDSGDASSVDLMACLKRRMILINSLEIFLVF